mgnify:CR=1 FL=1
MMSLPSSRSARILPARRWEALSPLVSLVESSVLNSEVKIGLKISLIWWLMKEIRVVVVVFMLLITLVSGAKVPSLVCTSVPSLIV